MKTTRRSALFFGLFFSLLTPAPAAHALELDYSGVFTFCNPTCDSFEALGAQQGGSENSVNSAIAGFIDLPVSGDNTFDFSPDDSIAFNFSFSNTAASAEAPVFGPDASCPAPNVPGQICNANSANPLPLGRVVGQVSGNGVIGSDGLPQSGMLIFTWDHPPLSSNGIEVRIDLGTGSGDGSVFGGVITFMTFEGEFASRDADGDGVANTSDNCLDQPNAAQRDTDGDGFGNRCDADLDNNCVVNFLDLGLFRSVFFSNDADGDFNGDGAVNFIDLGFLRAGFFRPPGPSALSEECASR